MDGLLIFDHSNELIYRKFDDGMKKKIRENALSHGLVKESAEEKEYLHSNVIIQLFSPIIASQRIMFCQFDNSYTSLQCENDLNIVFEDYLGFLLMKIGTQLVDKLIRSLGIAISFVKHMCGPDVILLKSVPKRADILSTLIDSWSELYKYDQNILVEAVEQLLVNSDIRSVAVKTLEAVTEKLKQDPHSQRSHALIFIKNKFLSIYSSRQAQELSSADILFLNVFCHAMEPETNAECSNKLFEKIQTHLIFLGRTSTSIPHIIHIVNYENDIKLVCLIEYGSHAVASSINDVFYSFHKLQNLQLQYDIENLKPSFDNLDLCMKHALDALKKAKYNKNDIENSIKKFTSKWDILKKKYLDLFKTFEKELIVKIESNIPCFVESLKELFKLTCFDCTTLEHGLQRISEISGMVESRLLEFIEFLQVKAQRNFTMTSYLEEFPGLVHFIHIDRSSGRVTAPHLDFTVPEKSMVSRDKIWSMVDISRSYLQKGHMAMMWKDFAFNYSYFLWFEDISGAPMKPKEMPNISASTVKSLLQPGIMAGDYYQRLMGICFPKIPHTKIKCFELYCVHLGLMSSSCVLEHCRRLAATINDVTGVPDSNDIPWPCVPFILVILILIVIIFYCYNLRELLYQHPK